MNKNFLITLFVSLIFSNVVIAEKITIFNFTEDEFETLKVKKVKGETTWSLGSNEKGNFIRAEAEPAADAAVRMQGEVAAPPGVSMAESAVTEVRKAEAVAAAVATADVEMEEAAVPAGAAAEREAVPWGMTEYQWVQQQNAVLRWQHQQKEGAAPVD